ncbi:glycosyltransferase family 8 protein [Thioclava sp. 'Guangxiensis']|uniref:glycosyltransferase family 8 protein n=1 Tax=Thioclava sp. 'Guangxiensis' TaxID=3149044 RepID=UPI003877C062
MTIKVNANRPATHRKAIIFCCDNGYLPYAALAAEQILNSTPTHDFDICIAFNERPVTIPESLAHLGIRLLKVDIGTMFEGLRLDAGKSHDVYLRLALPQALADDYDRILYMDSDIYVQGGDFSALMATDLGDRPLGAVRDNIQWRSPGRRATQFKRLGLPAAPYFNAGVLLMDVANYIASGLLEACLDLGRREAPRMIRHDQNLYNSVLQGNWAELSPFWNWQYSWAARFFCDVQGPNVIHFIGNSKPWKDKDGQFPPRFRQHYSRFIRTHFPEHGDCHIPEAQLPPDGARMRKMLIKHLLSSKAIARYLARFPTDLTVIK